MMKTVLAMIIFSAMTGACSKSSNNPSYNPDCSGGVKSYRNDVSLVMRSSCVSCHSQFSSYSGVASDKVAIRSSIVNGTMPPSNSLSVTQKNNVVCWIDSGAPDN